MSSQRTVTRLHPAVRDDIADLVTRRPVPGQGLPRVGAFLFLNHHGPQVYPPGNRGLPFGPHPHRGFETVSFILKGEMAHRDSAGNESVMAAGGVQWMTAGSGLIHAEVSPGSFLDSGGPLEILQLWVNLPARLKMTHPRYLGLQRDRIAAYPTPDGKGEVDLISGAWMDHQGPFPSLTGVMLATVRLRAGGRVAFDGLSGRDVFLYVVGGAVRVGGTAVPQYHLASLSDGGSVGIEATADAVVLFGHAEPIGEPVVAHGPFVMNTADEIRQAIADYNAGLFSAAVVQGVD